MAKRRAERKQNKVRHTPTSTTPPTAPSRLKRAVTRIGLVTLGGLAALGVFGPSSERISQKPNPPIVGSPAVPERLPTPLSAWELKARTDQGHVVPENGREFTLIQHHGITMRMPDASKNSACLQCHRVDQLPAIYESTARRLFDTERRIHELFRKKDIHSHTSQGIVAFWPTAYTRQMEGETTATRAHGLEVNLPVFATPAFRDDVISHELVHYATTHQDDQIPETWAIQASALIQSASTLSRLDTVEHRRVLDLLERVSVLNGRTVRSRGNVEKGPRLQRQIEKTLDDHREGDLDAIKPVFRESFGSYRDHTVFWDAAIRRYRNPLLPLDVHIAREFLLDRREHKHFQEALKHPTRLEENMRLLEETAKEHYRQMNLDFQGTYGRKLDRFEHRVFTDRSAIDPRQIMSANQPSGAQKQVDGAYYAALALRFLNSDGSLKFDAVSAAEKRKSMQEKRDYLTLFFQDELGDLEHLMKLTGLRKGLQERYRNYRDMLRKKKQKYDQELAKKSKK